MIKNVRIPLFLDLRMYNELLEVKATKKIIAKTDSELIYKILYDYCRVYDQIALSLDSMKNKIDVQKTDLIRTQETINLLQSTIAELRNDNDRLKSNIKIQKKRAKKK